MAHGTAERTTESNPDHPPGDIETMQQTAQEVLADGAKIEDSDELETIILLMRGMIMVLIPDVESATGKFPKSHTPAISARAGIKEARTRIYYTYGSDVPSMVGHAQRLARSVLALVRHYETLGCAT